jgi:DinB superfamily
MDAALPEDLQKLLDGVNAAERDARALVDGLTEPLGTWRAQAGSWSVAECLDHLAAANRVYLAVMEPAAARARANGSRRRGAARPGLIGRWFVSYLEPPVRLRGKAPLKIRPRSAPPLADSYASFLETQEPVRTFIRNYADIDLARVRFPNPFIRGVRFSLATGLHVIAAHERRHLWQAWRVRRAAEQSAGARPL